ncbi:hypothetical protein Cni_G18751 [Canna indica]|uniref:AB hydrolase-1 domain-containing protein n=1 Tax=Canna indica TaxID=4628 RepID=A0AAQ3KLN8_9LILI|nr:hypothetical protein Cni_G18751 [Canna indica]
MCWRISAAELHPEDISDTLYSRPSVVSQISKSVLNELRSLKLARRRTAPYTSEAACATRVRVVERQQGIKTVAYKRHSRPRWSDCACDSCTTSSDALHVHVESPQTDGKAAEEDVVFIHGFISSSKIWTETVFRHFTDEARARYRLIAVDLLGFANSPKPEESLYTLEEHVRMLEKCVLERYNVKSFHIVAHSLGSLLALALAVKYPVAVKSLTIVAPQKINLIDENNYRVRTYLMEGFFSYTHNAAWHTLHNVICGTGGKVVDGYLEALREEMSCDVVVYHGRDDELLPVDCSYAVKSRIPRARVKVVEDKDHITIVVGRQKAFARELEEIWWSASTTVRNIRTGKERDGDTDSLLLALTTATGQVAGNHTSPTSESSSRQLCCDEGAPLDLAFKKMWTALALGALGAVSSFTSRNSYLSNESRPNRMPIMPLIQGTCFEPQYGLTSLGGPTSDGLVDLSVGPAAFEVAHLASTGNTDLQRTSQNMISPIPIVENATSQVEVAQDTMSLSPACQLQPMLVTYKRRIRKAPQRNNNAFPPPPLPTRLRRSGRRCALAAYRDEDSLSKAMNRKALLNGDYSRIRDYVDGNNVPATPIEIEGMRSVTMLNNLSQLNMKERLSTLGFDCNDGNWSRVEAAIADLLAPIDGGRVQ